MQQHLLRIVISEDLDYEGVFEDILQKYTKTARLIQVKTINMGSMYELRYEIALAKDALVKEMIDDIRTLQCQSYGELQQSADQPRGIIIWHHMPKNFFF